ENTALTTGATYVWTQATTPRTATTIPFQAILMPFHTHLAPATIPFQTACTIGHSTSRNQLPTAETAILMPAHAALTPSRNQPTFLYMRINPATRSVTAVIIRQNGLAFIAALRIRIYTAAAAVANFCATSRPFQIA